LAKDTDTPITPLKLQKLLYFAHGWYLAFEGKPLLNESIEAWRFGPVVRSIYKDLQEFRDQSITRFVRSDFFVRPFLNPMELNHLAPFLKNVWDVYAKHTAGQLSNLTHKVGTPWREIYDACDGIIPFGERIVNKDIKSHFDKKWQRSRLNDR
jgi:uncharacterized phage-associated protein